MMWSDYDTQLENRHYADALDNDWPICATCGRECDPDPDARFACFASPLDPDVKSLRANCPRGKR